MLSKQVTGRFEEAFKEHIGKIQSAESSKRDKIVNRAQVEWRKKAKVLKTQMALDFKQRMTGFFQKWKVEKGNCHRLDIEDLFDMHSVMEANLGVSPESAEQDMDEDDKKISEQTQEKIDTLTKEWDNLKSELLFIDDKQKCLDMIKEFFKENKIVV